MDLKAILEPQSTAPTLTISPGTGGVTIAWSPVTTGQKLYLAPDITGPWSEIAGATNPYTAPIAGERRFYRVGP